MSTSPPSAHQQPDLSPFKEQTPFDPYLPTSPDDEQLTAVHAQRTRTDAARTRPAESSRAPGAYHGPRVDSNISASDPTASRTDTFGFDSYVPPGFENTHLFDEFEPLGATYDYSDMPLFHRSSFQRIDTGRTEEPQSAATSKGTDFSRRSTGLATQSSQLMSPVLTDAASPDADSGSASKTRLLGGGDMSRVSSQSTSTPGQNIAAAAAFAQRTPALTTSSYEVTPNMADQQQPMFPPIMPSIQVDYHRRGDSPARLGDDMDHSLQKRRRGSHSSSQLAVNTGHVDEAADGDDDAPLRGGRDPPARNDGEVPSLAEQAEQQQLQEKQETINNWLSASQTDGADPNVASAAPEGVRQHLKPGGRRRAVSNSNPSDLPAEAFGFSRGLQANAHARTPGPGVLINEKSDDGLDDDGEIGSFVESAPPSIDGHEAAAKAEEHDQFPAFEVQSPEQEAHPWIDPIYMPSHPDMHGQPETANAAMARFVRRARDIETASRVATWGTMPRRLSDSDAHMDRVFGAGGLLARLSISKDKNEEWRTIRETVERAADRIRPKRANSTSKRKSSEPSRPSPEKSASYDSPQRRKDSGSGHHWLERKESTSSNKASNPPALHLTRLPSVSKLPKSPGLITGGIAAAALSTQIAALGAGSISPTGPSTPMNWKERAKERLSFHHRAVSHSPETTYQSPPPMAAAVAPPPPVPAPIAETAPEAEVEEDVAEESIEHGVTMNLSPSKSNIVPTFEGFKAHVREECPRLPPYLVERLGGEQLRRYKKLVSFRVEHARLVEQGTCPSGAFCSAKGGKPRYFPPRKPAREAPRLADDDDEDDEVTADGIVSEAQFPQGLPLPPATRLPAEFECPLCFTVKKFLKPSDWSKHVHEDLQPFTCTFHPCPEPKSFKRKADWVRHENERHRQLEWWQCTEDGCSHLCYRRDNFVQHLVREHKLPEPKSKTPRPTKPVRGPAKAKPKGLGKIQPHEVPPEDRVLYMVEVCRRETSKSASTEPCRFCSNHCNSFKKLTVHLARHMETLSLPILAMAEARDVSSDTIISPVEFQLTHGLSPIDQAAPGFPSPAEAAFAGQDAMEHGANSVGMQPLLASNLASNFPPYTQNWTPNSHMSAAPVAAYTGAMAGPWVASSSGLYDTSPAPHMGYAASHLPYAPVQNDNIYAPAPFGMDERPAFNAPNYLDTHPHLSTEGMDMQYDPTSSGPYSQAPNAGMYGQAPAPGQGQGQGSGYYYPQ